MRLVLLLALGFGCKPVTQDCMILENDAGDAMSCAATGTLVYVCTLSDASVCWYDTDDSSFYATGACDDPRSWETPATDLVAYCTP